MAANQQAALAEWRQRFDIDVGRSQRQLSWGVKVAAFLAALALGMGVFLLLWRLWHHMNEVGQIMLPLLAAVLFTAGCGLFAAREKGGLFALLFGVLASVCFGMDVALLGHMFNIPGSPGFYLLLGLFALALALAAASRLPLAVAVGALGVFVAAGVAQMAGMYWAEGMRWMECWLPAAALLAACAWWLQRRGSELAPAARFVALLAWFVPALTLAFNGEHSFLPWEEKTVEHCWQLVTGLSAALLVALGVRRGWSETVYTSAFFGVLLLISKFFEWWWDALPKELFFLLVGLIAVLAVLLLRRLRAAKTGQGAPTAAPRQTAPRWTQRQRALLGTAAALTVLVIGNGAALLKMRANAVNVQTQWQLSAREVVVRGHEDAFGRSTTVQLDVRQICAEKEGEGWSGEHHWCSRPAPWMDAGKMRALGYGADVVAAEERKKRMPERPVWLVLELAGPAWQRQVERSRERVLRDQKLLQGADGDTACKNAEDVYAEIAEAARSAASDPACKGAQVPLTDTEKRLCEELEARSRLFVVDAGRSMEELRQRWPDAAHHAIAPGYVRWDKERPRVELAERNLYVPRRFAAAADAVRAVQDVRRRAMWKEEEVPSTADLAPLPAPLLRWGALGLPWIAAWQAAPQ